MADPSDATADEPGPLTVEVHHDTDGGRVRISWDLRDLPRPVVGYEVALGLDGQYVPVPHQGTDPHFDYPEKVFGVSVPLELPLRVRAHLDDGSTTPWHERAFVLEPLHPLPRSDEWEVGDTAVVVDDLTRRSAGLDWWVDGTIGLVPVEGGSVGFAANGPDIARWVVDGGHLTQIDRAVPVRGLDPSTRYAAGGPVLVEPSGALLLLYHGEEHPDGEGGGFWGFVGLARSTDGGRSFVDLGRIVTPEMAVDNPRRLPFTEVGGAPYLVRDGHLWVYFRETLASGRPLNLSVARAPLDEVLAEARRGRAAPFRKHRDGRWSEPGLGGAASELCPEPPGPRWFDVVAMVDHDLVVMVQSDGAGLEWATSVRTSADGLTWSRPSHLWAPESGAELLYLSACAPDPDDRREVRGDVLHLYRTRSARSGEHRWDDAVLERVVVRRRRRVGS